MKQGVNTCAKQCMYLLVYASRMHIVTMYERRCMLHFCCNAWIQEHAACLRIVARIIFVQWSTTMQNSWVRLKECYIEGCSVTIERTLPQQREQCSDEGSIVTMTVRGAMPQWREQYSDDGIIATMKRSRATMEGGMAMMKGILQRSREQCQHGRSRIMFKRAVL